MHRINDNQQALLAFVDNNFTSLYQALIMARDSNNAEAARLETEPNQDAPGWPGPTRQLAKMMRESAQSWNGHAEELSKLYDALPQEG